MQVVSVAPLQITTKHLWKKTNYPAMTGYIGTSCSPLNSELQDNMKDNWKQAEC